MASDNEWGSSDILVRSGRVVMVTGANSGIGYEVVNEKGGGF